MKTVVWAVLAALLAAAVGFYVGVTYQKAQVQAGGSGRFAGQNGGSGFRQGGNGNVPGGGQRGTGRMGGSVATGTVLSQNANSITVKTADGGSKTVFLSANTRISKQQQLTAADLKVGDEVFAAGQAASGGIDARSVTVVPPGSEFRFGGPGGGGAAPGF